MAEITRIWNLGDPSQAREFLSKLNVDGPKGVSPITYVMTESGETVFISDMTDAQVIEFASQIAELVMPGEIRTVN
jgi:hypothetical protein